MHHLWLHGYFSSCFLSQKLLQSDDHQISYRFPAGVSDEANAMENQQLRYSPDLQPID